MAIPAHRPARILHVTADFPDPIAAQKTPVIRSLVDLTSDKFSHSVISINRRTPSPAAFAKALFMGRGFPAANVQSQPFPYGYALSYDAPPKGLFHATMLHALGDWLAQEVGKGPRPDLIIGHKLTFEGLAVRRACEQLNIPFAISVQGDLDGKVLTARPDLRKDLGRVFHEARIVFPFAPWSLRMAQKRLGTRQGPVAYLPCPTELDTPLSPTVGGNGLLTVFHLKNHRRKNLAAMVRAMALVQPALPDARLAIVGGGSDGDKAACLKVIGNQPTITLAGAVERHAMQARMNAATAFIMPSLRESFGLVFIEALFAGLPIIYPAGTAVDGYLDGLPFAIKVNARSAGEIARAITQTVECEAQLKAALADWQLSEASQQFTRRAIAAQFTAGIETALGIPAAD